MRVLDLIPTQSARRMAPLNAADWRFLLPAPPSGRFDHLLLLGGTPALAERVRALGIARSVSCTLADSPPADAVVALSGARAELSAVVRHLRSDGVMYLERQCSGLLRGLREVTRGLEGAGLTVLDEFAVTHGRTYLPCGVTSAFRWFATTLRSPAAITSRTLDAGIGALLSLGARHLGLAPSYAVIASARRDSARPAVLGDPMVSALVDPGDAAVALITRGGDRVVLLLCRRGDRWPLAVLKVPRAPEFNDRTINEHRVLSRLHRDLAASLRDSVPAPMGLVRCGEITVAIESFKPGRTVACSSRQWGRPLTDQLSDLRAGTRWLAEFHRASEMSRDAWGETDVMRWIAHPAGEYRNHFGTTDAEEHLFARARHYAASLCGLPFPLVWQHRDFKPSHVLRRGRSITVIDWEGGRPGPPLCDLLHFMLHWHGAVRGVPAFPAVARLFFHSGPPDAISRSVKDALNGYMRALRLDTRFLGPLLVYACIELALRRAEQQRIQGESHERPRTGNNNVALVDVLARHAHELFPDDARRALAG